MNRNTKNADIFADAKLKEALDAGKIIIIDKVPTENPNFIQIYMGQFVEGLGTSSSNSDLNDTQRLFLGFNKNLVRCIQNAEKKVADKFEVGSTVQDALGGDFALKVIDGYEANYEQDTPRANRDGEIYVCAESGQKVYRKAIVTTPAEAVHELIEVVTEEEYKASAGVPKNKLEGAKK